MGIFSSARWRALFTAVAALSLLAAACSPGPEPVADADEATESSIPDDLDAGVAQSTTTTTTTTAPENPVIAVTFDVGVSDDAIRIGYSIDLSGPSSAEDAVLLDGHFARIDAANEAGGIAGRVIEVVVLDNGGDPGLHQQNLTSLASDGADGVLAIGGLTQPSFDGATASALAGSDLLVIGNRVLESGVSVPRSFVPFHPAVCSDTRTGVAALAASDDGERTQFALLTSDEDWAQASADVARALVEDLEFEVVLDTSFDAEAADAQSELLEALLDSDAQMVWVAGSAEFLSELGAVLALDEDQPSWTWGGTSATSSAAVFDSIVGPVLADVYQVSRAGPLVEDDSLSDVREALAVVAPELSIGEAAPAILGWQQGDLLIAALEQAASADDLTRGAVGSAGVSLAPDIPETAVYEIQLSSARNATLSAVGDSGLAEVFNESDIPNTLTNPYS